MGTVWIDVTDLFEWKGFFTGIQRVTYNYASRFAEEGARFFVYSSLYDRFVEVPFDMIGKQSDEVPKRRVIKRKLKERYSKLPSGVRVVSGPTLRAANKAFRKGAALVLDGKGRDGMLRKMPKATFADNDQIILLDAGWNVKGLIPALAAQKSLHKITVTLHINDLLPIYQPYLFAKELIERFTKYVHKALRVADHVTVISNATKQDVERYIQENSIPNIPVTVIRLGEDMKSVVPEKPAIEIAEKFIFCVGTFEIRKNYILLYQAVRLAQQEGIEIPQIIIAGRRGWLSQDLQYVIENDPSVADKIIIFDKASDGNLSWLFDNCQFSVFCSLAEGWGLPIAESLQHGKLCLAANTSSMPEIAGDLIDYFSPYDTRGCLEKITYYTKDDRYIAKNKEIQKQYKIFTWDDSFEQFRNAIR